MGLVYVPTFIIQTSTIHVGEYTNPMDPMGIPFFKIFLTQKEIWQLDNMTFSWKHLGLVHVHLKCSSSKSERVCEPGWHFFSENNVLIEKHGKHQTFQKRHDWGDGFWTHSLEIVDVAFCVAGIVLRIGERGDHEWWFHNREMGRGVGRGWVLRFLRREVYSQFLFGKVV